MRCPCPSPRRTRTRSGRCSPTCGKVSRRPAGRSAPRSKRAARRFGRHSRARASADARGGRRPRRGAVTDLFARAAAPVLAPDPGVAWASGALFNPGACRDEAGTVRLLARGVPAGHRRVAVQHADAFEPDFGFADYVSALGLATRKPDGAFALASEPLLAPHADWDRWGCEDARITHLNGRWWITYTALSEPAAVADRGVHVALASTADWQTVRAPRGHRAARPRQRRGAVSAPRRRAGLPCCTASRPTCRSSFSRTRRRCSRRARASGSASWRAWTRNTGLASAGAVGAQGGNWPAADLDAGGLAARHARGRRPPRLPRRAGASGPGRPAPRRRADAPPGALARAAVGAPRRRAERGVPPRRRRRGRAGTDARRCTCTTAPQTARSVTRTRRLRTCSPRCATSRASRRRGRTRSSGRTGR